eukprot:11206831-Lingulodinium_polyedra.AAC.1
MAGLQDGAVRKSAFHECWVIDKVLCNPWARVLPFSNPSPARLVLRLFPSPHWRSTLTRAR